MSIAVNGADGNPFGTRDVDGSASNYAYSTHRLVFSGSYSTGGDPLDLSSVATLVPTALLPISITVTEQGTAATPSLSAAGGFYAVVQAAVPTLKNFLLKVFKNTGGSVAEYGAGAYTADVLTDVVILSIQWRKLIN